jgi:hypothetical protein
MTSQALIEAPPETTPGSELAAAMVSWRLVPGIPLRQRIAGWRARHWRRLVLGWFVLSLVIVAIAAEPRTSFPKAPMRTVPAVAAVLRVAGGITIAGIPLVLIVLP